jgi:ribosomal protein S17
METKTSQKNYKERLSGIVTSDKMKDTCVVVVERYVQASKVSEIYSVTKEVQSS